MTIYYKSVRYINGKSRWILEDENGCIFKYPTKEQLKLAILDDPKRTLFKGRKCRKCGNDKTKMEYHNPKWYKYYDEKGYWNGGYICYDCYWEIGERKNIDERTCNICEGGTYIDRNGIPIWRKNRDEKGNWDGHSFLCTICYERFNPNSKNNLLKSVALCRNEEISISGKKDKGRIGEDIVSITLGLKNQNDISNNYNSPFDLFFHPKYGKIGVKIRGQLYNYEWNFSDINSDGDYDTILLLCMDNNKPWKNVDRVYAIPIEAINVKCISIYKNPSRRAWYDEFRIDEKPYNDSYHLISKIRRDWICKIFEVDNNGK